VADDDDLLTATVDRRSDVVGCGTGSEALVRLCFRSGCLREGRCGLPRPQERAGEHGVRLDAVGLQALPELPRLLAPLAGQRAQLVRLAGSRIGVAHEIKLHPAGRIDRDVRLSLQIRDLVVASWRIERTQAQALLPPELEPAPVDGDHLVSLVGMRYEAVRTGRLRLPGFAQINVRTYAMHAGEPAVYFLLSRVTLPGLPAALLGVPYGLARISVGRGRVDAPGLGVSLRYRVEDVVESGPLGLHETGLFGRGRLRVVKVHRSPAVWHRAVPEGPARADPILAYGLDLASRPSVIYSESARFELDAPLRTGE
jgi:hypothetical protein